MIPAWSHLPNAVHIDKILASLKAHPGKWMNAYTISTRDNVYHKDVNDVLRTLRNSGRREAFNAASLTTMGHTQDNAYYSAMDAITVLIVYDDSAHLLDSSPEELSLLNALGHPYAILMSGAAIAFSEINAESPIIQ